MATFNLHGLGEAEFPMLRAFDTLNFTASNMAQSAPTCGAEYTLEKWAEIEGHLRNLTAFEFVTLAIPGDSPLYEQLEARPEFKEWMKTWV
jgi:hypothetical protein